MVREILRSGFKLDAQLGARLVVVNTVMIVFPAIFLFMMRVKGQSIGWLEHVLLVIMAIGIAAVGALGVAKIGHTALNLGPGRGWQKFILYSGWIGLCFLLVGAATIVLLSVSSKQPYLKVIQPDFIQANWPNVLVCFLVSFLGEVTILKVMYSDAVSEMRVLDTRLRDLEREKDEIAIQRNAAQAECKRLQDVDALNRSLKQENEKLTQRLLDIDLEEMERE